MKQVDDIRKILAAQALEQADLQEVVLSDKDKREVASIAGAPLPGGLSTGEENQFITERSSLLLIRAGSRFPGESRWFQHPPDRTRFGWVTLTLCLVAVLIGFLSNELGPEKRINILSFPLLGIIAWSLVVYFREVVLFFRNRKALFRDSWLDGVIRFLQPKSSPPASRGTTEAVSEEGQVFDTAYELFRTRWRELLTPVTGARIKSLLHLVAFLLALSAIGGMYLQGLANEYRAVWESTFFTDSESLRPFLQAVLGPAASLNGSAIPSVVELDAMHWKAGAAGEVPGENAARWIHWYAITVGLFVLIPRAVLVLVWKWRASCLARTLPFREVSPRYYEHLLSTSSGAPLESIVLPYSVQPDDAQRRALRSCIEVLYERPVELTWMPTVPFGEEDEIDLPKSDIVLHPLFNFSSTPEKETHLALLRTLSGDNENTVEYLFLDTTAFDRKSESFPDASHRREARIRAWESLLETVPITPIFFSCDRPFTKPEPKA